ncbi:hypothetical protein BX616_001722 [Lobosporangium transversale]|nr:hypothetical protein BX616_001722 [Lobosporangium transversale]
MTASTLIDQPLHNPTPLLHSTVLSRKTQTNIWLKLENLQPSGSFKIRGLGHMCQKAALKHGSKTRLVSSSGGNAGLAVAYAARQLGIQATIIVPQTCNAFMIKKIKEEGAHVEMHGELPMIRMLPLLTVETHGSNSFQQSVLAGELVTLPKITSIATTLGAKTPSAKSLELSLVHPVVPFAVSDAMAASACWQFLDDHRFAVEPSCGTALSIAYTPALLSNIFPNLNQDSNVVFIVCGGSNINFAQLTEFKEMFGAEGQQSSIAVRSGDQILLKMTTDATASSQKAILSTTYKPEPKAASVDSNNGETAIAENASK